MFFFAHIGFSLWARRLKKSIALFSYQISFKKIQEKFDLELRKLTPCHLVK